MTRIGIISDVHADVHAIEDALSQMRRLGCDLVVCGGDLVDEGRFPEKTLTLLRERRIPTIRGNHDRWAIETGAGSRGWVFTSASMSYLRSLPTSWSAVVDGVRVVMWHASPGNDMGGIYPDTPDGVLHAIAKETRAGVYMSGHTHVPLRRTVGGCLFVNPGTLLRDALASSAVPMVFDPKEGKFVDGSAPIAGTFGILDLPAKGFTVHRASDGSEVEVAGTDHAECGAIVR